MLQNDAYLMIQFISILAFGMFWYKLLHWTPEQSICMAIASAIATILAGAFLGQALVALAIIYIFSLMGVIWLIFGSRRKTTTVDFGSISQFFTPGVVLLILVFLYGMVAFAGSVLYNWDEMSQWGKAVNWMLNHNSLPYGPEFDGEAALLSTTTVFHYYFCKLPTILYGGIVESNMYVSNLVLWFSAVILLFSGLTWKDWQRCAAYAAMVFLSINVLSSQPYYTVCGDHAVAIWAGSLIAWNLFVERKKYNGVFIVLALLNIALLKNMMGPLFAVIAAIAMAIKYILNLKGSFKKIIISIIQNIRMIVYAGICMAAIFIPTMVWSARIRQNALIRGSGVIHVENNRLRLTLLSGLAKWFQPVNLSDEFPNVTFLVAMFMTIILGYILAKKYLANTLQKQYAVLTGIYAAGFLGFFVIMLYAYLTTFTYADSINTGSLNRYFSDYILLGLLPITCPVFRGGVPDKERMGRISAELLALLIFFGFGMKSSGFAAKITTQGLAQTDVYQDRVQFQQYKENALNLMDNHKKICMVNQDSYEYANVAADYVFDRLLDRSTCYYLTESQSLVSSNRADIRNLPRILLNGYGYLWIYKTDDYFNKNAFDVLKIKEPTGGEFYKIVNNQGSLKLEYLGNISSAQEHETIEILDGIEILQDVQEEETEPVDL